MKTLGLCSDHAGYELKEFVKQILDSKGLAYKDFGTDSTESCDYPDYAHPLAKAVEAGEVYPGIAICGSGNGIAMTLNKHQGIRAALCWQEEIARLAREHNNANILVMPGLTKFLCESQFLLPTIWDNPTKVKKRNNYHTIIEVRILFKNRTL